MQEKEFTTIPAAFLARTEVLPESVAIQYKANNKWQIITYAELRSHVFALATYLCSEGIKPGDKIAILSQNCPEWIVADLAIMTTGAVSVPIYPTLQSAQIKFILAESETRALLVENREQYDKIKPFLQEIPSLRHIILKDPVGVDLTANLFSLNEVIEKGLRMLATTRDEVIEKARRVGSQDLASIVYTSGTTGNPKGVMLTHGNFMSNANAIRKILDLTTDDSLLSFLPLSHVLERTASYFACFLVIGLRFCFAERIETVADNLREIKPSLMVGVPRFYEKVYGRIQESVYAGSKIKQAIFAWAVKVGERYQRDRMNKRESIVIQLQHQIAHALVFKKLHERVGGQMRYFISGGAPLEPRIAEFFFAVGLPIYEGFGLTETSPVTNVNSPEYYRIGSVGRVVRDVQVQIAQDGEILVKGPNVFQGYFKNPDATQEAFTEDGWFKTGDIGRIDADGFLWITDRKKEIFVTSGGKNIAPQPIENFFKTNPFVQQIMLIGDRKNFLSAVIVPNFERLQAWAKDKGIRFDTNEDLIKNADVISKYDDEIRIMASDLPRFEQVRRIILVSREWTVETGELTPTLKLKRKVILENYRDRIEKLYLQGIE